MRNFSIRDVIMRPRPHGLKPPLHRAVTFVPSLSDPKYDQDAQRSPKPRESCFCVTASATFVPPLKDLLFKDRMWRHNKSHKGGRTEARTIDMDALASPCSPNGGRVVVTVIVQSTLLEAQRRHRGGRNVAHIEGLSFAVERICYMAIIGRPLCIHSATKAMQLRPLCLI